MCKLLFISAVSCVGKTTICDYIKNNNLLENYSIYDIDDLENINMYTSDLYNIFYENAIKKATKKSNGKNIIIGSCINPNDIEKIAIPKEIELIEMILITCSDIELEKRLKQRDASRNCGSDEYIKAQINYQKYLLKYLSLYNLHLDNSNCSIESISNQIVNYIKEKMVGDKK